MGFLRVFALIVQIVPDDSWGALMGIRDSIGANVIFLTRRGVRDEVQGIITEATDGPIRIGLNLKDSANLDT